jgi:hypothetical protein
MKENEILAEIHCIRAERPKGPSPCSLIWLRAKTNAKPHEPCVQLEFQSAVWEKEVLAWWLCQHTTARRRWMSERLGMGDESRVTQAIGRLKRKGRPELERLKRRLEQVYEIHNAEVEARIYRFRETLLLTAGNSGGRRTHLTNHAS